MNVVLKKERQRVLRPGQAARLLADLDGIGVEIVDLLGARTFEQLAALARPHQLSAYDAAYLDLAIAMSASLITLDNNLAIAAAKASGTVVSSRDG